MSDNNIHIYKREPRCGNNTICINKLRNERVWGPLAKLKKKLTEEKIKEARLPVSDFSVLATPTRAAHFQSTDNAINMRMYNE